MDPLMFERFGCEICGRSESDLPIDDAQMRSLFPGDDGSCCRAVRAEIAHRQIEGILDGEYYRRFGITPAVEVYYRETHESWARTRGPLWRELQRLADDGGRA